MTDHFNSILSNYLIPEKGISTYLQYKMHQLWPNLYGLSLLTFGETETIIPQKMWYPSYHIHGHLTIHEINHPFVYSDLNCYFSVHHFPFQNCNIDRILYVHNHHMTKEEFTLFLRACWQILDDSGKIILLLPNQLGWWSIIDNLSLKYRNVFQIKKLNRLLTENMFCISHYERLLYSPPKLMNILSLRANKALEFLGVFFVPFLGGYHCIEIKKDLYAPITIAPVQKKYILQQRFSTKAVNCKKSSS